MATISPPSSTLPDSPWLVNRPHLNVSQLLLRFLNAFVFLAHILRRLFVFVNWPALARLLFFGGISLLCIRTMASYVLSSLPISVVFPALSVFRLIRFCSLKFVLLFSLSLVTLVAITVDLSIIDILLQISHTDHFGPSFLFVACSF